MNSADPGAVRAEKEHVALRLMSKHIVPKFREVFI